LTLKPICAALTSPDLSSDTKFSQSQFHVTLPLNRQVGTQIFDCSPRNHLQRVHLCKGFQATHNNPFLGPQTPELWAKARFKVFNRRNFLQPPTAKPPAMSPSGQGLSNDTQLHKSANTGAMGESAF